MMPTPLFVMALQAARKARSGDEAASETPKDRRSSIRVVWNAGDKPARQATTPHPTHTKER
jgi:hypothetical protein